MVWTFPQTPWGGVFVTRTVDNLDESSRYEFHGRAMTLTNHPTQDNMGEDPPPLDYNVPEGTSVELPVDFEFAPYLDKYAGDISQWHWNYPAILMTILMGWMMTPGWNACTKF